MSTPTVNNHFHFYGKLGACAEDEDREKEGVDFDKKLDHRHKLEHCLFLARSPFGRFGCLFFKSKQGNSDYLNTHINNSFNLVWLSFLTD